MTHYDYIRDGAEIYANSFAIIRSESDLVRFSELEERIAVRIIHACGMPEIASEIAFSERFAERAVEALNQGRPILCDANMVAHGITRARLPNENEVMCTLRDPAVAELASKLKTTRTAAAMELWREHLDSSLVVIGNAPTALFRLLEMIDEGAPRPAAIIGMPVGFVGAAESKEALSRRDDLEWAVVRGRKGGSAMAAAAVNAIASDRE